MTENGRRVDARLLVDSIENTYHVFAETIAARLRRRGVSTVAFDFGCTITKTHLIPTDVSYDDIVRRPDRYAGDIVGHFNMRILAVLVRELRAAQITVVVNSFGNRDVVHALLKSILPDKSAIFTQRVAAVYKLASATANPETGRALCKVFREKYAAYDELAPDVHQERYADDLRALFGGDLKGLTPDDYHDKYEHIVTKDTLMDAIRCWRGEALAKDTFLLVDNNEKNVRDVRAHGYGGMLVDPSTCVRARGFLDTFLAMYNSEFQ